MVFNSTTSARCCAFNQTPATNKVSVACAVWRANPGLPYTEPHRFGYRAGNIGIAGVFPLPPASIASRLKSRTRHPAHLGFATHGERGNATATMKLIRLPTEADLDEFQIEADNFSRPSRKTMLTLSRHMCRKRRLVYSWTVTRSCLLTGTPSRNNPLAITVHFARGVAT